MLGAKDVGNTLGLDRARDRLDRDDRRLLLARRDRRAPHRQRSVAKAQPPVSGDAIVGSPVHVEAASWTTDAGRARPTRGSAATRTAACACRSPARPTDTYSLTADDVGHVLVAAVTGSGQTVLSLGSGLGRAAPGPVASGRPAVSGALQQGKKLTASAGTWAGSGTITYAYQWYRCDAAGAHCSSIHGSTKSTYTQVAADTGKTIALTVRATDATGTTSAYSSLAGLVAPASVDTRRDRAADARH